MENIAIQKASQIDSAARQWLQRLFGRALSEDEEVTVFIPAARKAPAQEKRSAALKRVGAVFDTSAASMQFVSDEEFDDALDEAMQHIRKLTE